MSRSSRVLLIYPPADQGYTCDYLEYVPLSLHALQKYVERECNAEVRIINGSNNTLAELKSSIEHYKPHILGVSSLLISHGMSLELLEFGKSLGALTVMGGHNVSNLGVQILKNRPYVDYVVRGDGEVALVSLIEERSAQDISNLVYRSNDDIVVNPIRDPALDSLPLCEISDSDLGWHPIISHKGCLKRELEGACVFCGRADKGFRAKSPKLFVNEIVHLHDEHGVRVLFDVGDDILFRFDWLSEVAELMPERVSADMSIIAFANVRSINKDSIDLLKRLGFVKLVFGLESGDLRVLKKCNKPTDPGVALRRVQDCIEAGFSLSAAYVLGLPGENDSSLRNTVDQAKRIWDLVVAHGQEDLSAVTANIIEPLPGSSVFKGLQKYFPEKYLSRDMLYIKELQDDYFASFFKILESPKFSSVLSEFFL